MNDDLERRLRTGLSLDGLPTAPDELRTHLEQLADREPRPMRSWLAFAAAIFTMALLGIALLGIVWIGDLTAPAPTPTPTPSPTPVAPTATPIPTVAAPASVEGIPVMTVSELLAARAAGELVDRPVALKGFWTNRSIGHSCNAPRGKVGDLEIRCHDGEFGITEQFEAIGDLTSDARWFPAEGPHLTPWVSEEVFAQFLRPDDPGYRWAPCRSWSSATSMTHALASATGSSGSCAGIDSFSTASSASIPKRHRRSRRAHRHRHSRIRRHQPCSRPRCATTVCRSRLSAGRRVTSFTPASSERVMSSRW